MNTPTILALATLMQHKHGTLVAAKYLKIKGIALPIAIRELAKSQGHLTPSSVSP